jgi:ketosteroid isomerase-like protein
MKKIILKLKINIMSRSLLTLIVLLMMITSTQAQTKNEARVARMVKDLNSAIVARDSFALAQISMDELSFGHSGGVIQDKAAFIKAVLNGPTFFKSIDPEGQTIQVSGKHAIVRHIVVASATREGNPVPLRFGNVMVWYKKQGKWKLLARQGYKL